MPKKKIKLDEFYYHEAVDRMHVIINLIENELIEHPVLIKHKKLRKSVKKAQKILINSYQKIGRDEYLKFDGKNSKNQ